MASILLRHTQAGGGGGTGGVAGDSFNHDLYIISSSAIARFVESGGARWIDLTDGGSTTLHTHPGGGSDVAWSGATGFYAFSSNVKDDVTALYSASSALDGRIDDIESGIVPSGNEYTWAYESIVNSGNKWTQAYSSGQRVGDLFNHVLYVSSSNRDLCGFSSIIDGGTISHNLGSIPSWIGITPSGSNPIAFSYKVDAVNITVYHTSLDSEVFSWRVKK